ncbi:hypothetical protein FHX45_004567 [Amycolatopsis granulosa]|nr:hypothetical protein [Amycolatopsis granulosa]
MVPEDGEPKVVFRLDEFGPLNPGRGGLTAADDVA